MDAAKALEWVLGDLERLEVETLQWLIAIAVAKEAQRERGRASTRSPETLIESLCRILECQPHEALARVEALAAKEKRTASIVTNYAPALQRLADGAEPRGEGGT